MQLLSHSSIQDRWKRGFLCAGRGRWKGGEGEGGFGKKNPPENGGLRGRLRPVFETQRWSLKVTHVDLRAGGALTFRC